MIDYERDGHFYRIQESYKKGKYWEVSRYKEVLKKKRNRGAVYKQVLDGFQYSFDDNGKVLYISNYKLDEFQDSYFLFEYYPNGEIKYIAEGRDDLFWNFLEYKFPDGTFHDFGDFKDGEGVVLHLDDKGEPCLECSTLNNKTVGKILCDENDEIWTSSQQ